MNPKALTKAYDDSEESIACLCLLISFLDQQLTCVKTKRKVKQYNELKVERHLLTKQLFDAMLNTKGLTFDEKTNTLCLNGVNILDTSDPDRAIV